MHVRRTFASWGCLCTVVYFEKGFDWFVVMYACTVAAVVLNSIWTALNSDIWPVRFASARPTPVAQMSLRFDFPTIVLVSISHADFA